MVYLVFDGNGILVDISQDYGHARQVIDGLADQLNPPSLEIYSEADFAM